MSRSALALGESLAAEATCPVCLELFRGPVLTECGHSFCGPCLAAVRARPGPAAACPQCRAALREPPRPNRALGAVAELAAEARRPRCPEHGEALGPFCEGCRRPRCPRCPPCPGGARHRDQPAEEAARRLRETLQSELIFLQKQKAELKPEGEKSDVLLEKVASERELMSGLLEMLQNVLRDVGDTLLAQFDEAQEELAQQRREHVSSVAERMSLLATLIPRVEKKRDQPAMEFLVDIDQTLRSCEAAKAPPPGPVSAELQRTVQSLCETRQAMLEMAVEFLVKLFKTVDRERVGVTLDPETLSPELTLSEDCRAVWLGDGRRRLPSSPRRFTGSPSVLGSQGFVAGRHHWQVEVGDGGCWAVGVAAESVLRRYSLSIAMGKIWALQLEWNHQYWALHVRPALLALEEDPRVIDIHLDYEAGEVTFCDVERNVQILQLKASFTEKVFPYFWLQSEKTSIQLLG